MYAHTCTHSDTFTHLTMNSHMHTFILTCSQNTFTCAHRNISIHAHVHLHTLMRIHIQTHLQRHILIHACIYTHLYTYIWEQETSLLFLSFGFRATPGNSHVLIMRCQGNQCWPHTLILALGSPKKQPSPSTGVPESKRNQAPFSFPPRGPHSPTHGKGTVNV